MNKRNYSIIAFFLFLIVCYGTAALGGYFTSLSVGDWYLTLEKPFWNPPGWVFGPVWMFLYGCMAIAGWLVWSSGSWKKINVEISLFFVQLGFNLAWSILFFGLKNPFVAFIDILALWGFITATMASFLKFSKLAFFLMFLYLAWVTYAMTLNYAIFLLN